MKVDLIVKNIDFLITCDREWNIFENGAIVVTGGKILFVGKTDELAGRFQSDNVVDLSGYIVAPGFINCHVHVPMSIFRGLGDDLPLEKWLHEVIFPAEAKWINRETVYLGSLLSISEMLLSGVTTFCDGYFFEEQVAKAAVSCGIRAITGQGILDFPVPDNPNPESFIERAEEFLKNFPSGNLVRPSIFCHAPYTCSDETIKRVKEFCRNNNIIFQIHLAETEQEVRDIKNRYGVTPGRLLYELGVYDDKTVCVHAVWLSGEELEIIKEHNVSLVHCIESNLKLASGIARLPDWISMGITFGLGTDGPASNNDLSILSELNVAALVHKGVNRQPTYCRADDVLKAATILGAKALGMDDIIGSIEPDKEADFIALDITKPHAVPLYDPVSHIVYSAKTSDVKHVWIAGKQVVEDGRLLTVDVNGLISDVINLKRQIKP